MNEQFEHHLRALKSWSAGALEGGWISQGECAALDQIEQQQAAALFAQRGQRPLVVAFFGGTGVGKSSLLNRLAGSAIARVGLERPTSHEVTLYLHQDYRLDQLPPDLPLDETRIAYHQDDRRRLVAWLDMPDFDSVEERHRELVKAWLPYVDWLVYVVSPERYQDDIGWRFLQQRGNRHSWLFIMNQWDQGSPEQLTDLRLRLQEEGFSDPLILRTNCGDTGGEAHDDFDLLEQTINQAIQSYGLELLQKLGIQARMLELYRISERFLQRLHSHRPAELAPAWNDLLAERLAAVRRELSDNSLLLARGFQAEEKLPWQRSRDHEEQQTGALQPPRLLSKIWSDRIDTKLGDLAAELENLLRQRRLPLVPFRRALEPLQSNARGEFVQRAEGVVAKSLARPGSGPQQISYRGAVFLGWSLPLAATGWTVYHAVTGFYRGTRGESGFLGLDFAIHAGLLIVLSWLLPWLLQRKLKPSVVQSVDRGLRAGVQSGLEGLERQVEAGFRAACSELDDCISRLTPIRKQLSLWQKETATSLPWSREAAGEPGRDLVEGSTDGL